MKYIFGSGFAGKINEMLEHRATMGHSVSNYHDMLARFDRFCLKEFRDETILTKQIAFAWCNDAKGSGGIKRACTLRAFARYVQSMGENSYVLPPLFFPSQRAKPPYIMNGNELKCFFEATDHFSSSVLNPLLEFTVPVIFRLQYACGMRPQEARLLLRTDFDFADGTIYIAEGKYNKDRRLPVCTEIMDMCKKYDRIAESIIPNRTYFFQAPSGNVYGRRWLSNTFNICWGMSGNGVKPDACTPYVLRHNYATQMLMRLVEDGQDLDAMIPYLSAYMGHESFSATYYYVHLLPERLACMDFMRSDGVIPEAYDYEEKL